MHTVSMLFYPGLLTESDTTHSMVLCCSCLLQSVIWVGRPPAPTNSARDCYTTVVAEKCFATCIWGLSRARLDKNQGECWWGKCASRKRLAFVQIQFVSHGTLCVQEETFSLGFVKEKNWFVSTNSESPLIRRRLSQLFLRQQWE